MKEECDNNGCEFFHLSFECNCNANVDTMERCLLIQTKIAELEKQNTELEQENTEIKQRIEKLQKDKENKSNNDIKIIDAFIEYESLSVEVFKAWERIKILVEGKTK